MSGCNSGVECNLAKVDVESSNLFTRSSLFYASDPNVAAMTHSGKTAPALIAMLVCPVSKMPLRHDEAASELVSDAAKLAYPIRDGIPIMLPEEARKLA